MFSISRLTSRFEARWCEEEDYEELCKWWKAFRFPAPAISMLPDNGKSGIIVSKDGVNICAGFYYKTNSSFALCEYVVSNFEYKDQDRKAALEQLYSAIEMVAKADGFTLLFSTVKNQHLINKMIDFGWSEGSKTTEMIKPL